MLWGCEPEAPAVRREAVRKSALHAIALTRADFPGTSRYIQTLLDAAQSISAGERAAMPWNREPEREGAAWDRLASNTVVTRPRVRFMVGLRLDRKRRKSREGRAIRGSRRRGRRR